MDADAARTRVVAEVARGLIDDAGAGGLSDDDMAQAFHLAVGEMEPGEYEDLLLTLPDTTLLVLAAAGYVTTSHLLYGCGLRGAVPEGVAGYVAGVLVRVVDAGVLERFVGNAWFGYAYGLSAGAARGPGGPAVTPAAARAASDVLRVALVAAGLSPLRADEVLSAAGRTVEDRAVEMPEAYAAACAAAARLRRDGAGAPDGS